MFFTHCNATRIHNYGKEEIKNRFLLQLEQSSQSFKIIVGLSFCYHFIFVINAYLNAFQ